MRRNFTNFHFITLFVFLHFSSFIQCFDESLDTILHDHAFRVMIDHRPRTGALYNTTLPPNLSGMKVSIVGLRSTTLWRNGANFSDFIIPPKTLPNPYVKRLLIVYHNLGNWSSSYYALPGYTFLSPVVGFLVYDASNFSSRNLSKLELNTMAKPILIQFHNSATQGDQRAKCAEFRASGEVYLSEMSWPNVCYSTNTRGHFSVVIPLEKKKTKKKMWPFFWVIGFLAGFLGLFLVVSVGTIAVRSFLRKKSQDMEKVADDGECLETYWVASCRFPRAEVTRTQPVLETTTTTTTTIIRPDPKLSWYA